MIYDHLFFHSHSLALKSKENQDQPYFVSVTHVLMCFILNLFALNFLLEGFGYGEFLFKKDYKYVWVGLFMALGFSYYLYGKRYTKIYSRGLQKYGTPKTSKSIIIVIIYYVLSVLLAMLAGMFKNGDWVFS